MYYRHTLDTRTRKYTCEPLPERKEDGHEGIIRQMSVGGDVFFTVRDAEYKSENFFKDCFERCQALVTDCKSVGEQLKSQNRIKRELERELNDNGTLSDLKLINLRAITARIEDTEKRLERLDTTINATAATFKEYGYESLANRLIAECLRSTTKVSHSKTETEFKRKKVTKERSSKKKRDFEAKYRPNKDVRHISKMHNKKKGAKK